MKHYECKPCKYFGIKPSGKRKSICYFADEDCEERIPIKEIIWCQEYEIRANNKEEK